MNWRTLRRTEDEQPANHRTALSGQDLCGALALTLLLDLQLHDRHHLRRNRAMRDMSIVVLSVNL